MSRGCFQTHASGLQERGVLDMGGIEDIAHALKRLERYWTDQIRYIYCAGRIENRQSCRDPKTRRTPGIDELDYREASRFSFAWPIAQGSNKGERRDEATRNLWSLMILNPRPRDLDDAAAQQVLGEVYPLSRPVRMTGTSCAGKQPKAVTWFKNLFKKNGG